MPQILTWHPPSAPHAELIAPCVRALKAGQLIGLPCETCYFAVADPANKKGVAKLQQLLGPNPKLPILEVHAVTDRPEKALAGASGLARRLARRTWPGPIVISTALDKKSPMVPRYAPNSGSVRQMIQAMGHPLSFGVPIAKNGEVPSTAQELASVTGESLSVILDAGKSPFGNIPTVIEVTGNQYRIPLVGVVPAEALAEQTSWLGVFVCTGNTCRSPLAEELCKSMVASKLGCEPDELEKRGFRITSMGLSALPGNTATSEALIVAREFQVDLSAHRSRPMIPELLELADVVMVMTGIHRDSILALHPNLDGVTRLLCGSQDLSDPIGNDLEVYRTCAKTIQKHVEKLVSEVLVGGPPTQIP